MRLVAIDVDSTLIQDEVIDLLAAEAGCGERVAELTERGHGRRAGLRGRPAPAGGAAGRPATSTCVRPGPRTGCGSRPGARTFVRTLKRLGYRIALVSGGFTEFTDHLRDELGVDYAFANELEVADGRLTGRVIGPVVDRRRKAELLREVAAREGIELAQTVAVGDGANDLDMLATAGLGIAFNAKPLVRDAADTALSVPYLDAILFVLGLRRDDVVDADATPPTADAPTPRAGRVPSPTMAAAAPAEPPLAGIRVLDFTRYLAGPFATMLLGDYGADVVKVESPKGGSSAAEDGRDTYFFLSANRSKRSIVVDLDHARRPGAAAAHRRALRRGRGELPARRDGGAGPGGRAPAGGAPGVDLLLDLRLRRDGPYAAGPASTRSRRA